MSLLKSFEEALIKGVPYFLARKVATLEEAEAQKKRLIALHQASLEEAEMEITRHRLLQKLQASPDAREFLVGLAEMARENIRQEASAK